MVLVANQTLRVGELRPNQLLHTYGVGAVADLPNLSVVVAGLDDWELGNSLIVTERRLLSAVQAQLGPQVETLRTPPYKPETPDPFGDWARIGVPVRLFPRWLRCSDTRCNRLAPVESRLFDLLTDPWRPERIRYVHSCRGHGTAAPRRCPPGSCWPAHVVTWTTSPGCITCTAARSRAGGAHAAAERARHHW